MPNNHQVFLFFTDQLKEANGINGTPTPGNTTPVEPGDTIEWILGENSAIRTIDSITIDDDSLFSDPPHNTGNGWIGTISLNATSNDPEKPYNYDIGVTHSSGTINDYDPKIMVHSHFINKDQ